MDRARAPGGINTRQHLPHRLLCEDVFIKTTEMKCQQTKRQKQRRISTSRDSSPVITSYTHTHTHTHTHLWPNSEDTAGCLHLVNPPHTHTHTHTHSVIIITPPSLHPLSFNSPLLLAGPGNRRHGYQPGSHPIARRRCGA